jgi:ribosomal protein L11 methyltransferase
VRGARVLDAGCGSGVLALAALALGARSALGFDWDPLAARASRANAEENRRGQQFRALVGSLEALTGPPFDLVLANLLRTELLPLAPRLASFVRAGGTLIVSGLLAAEGAEVEACFRPHGLRLEGDRTSWDARGEHWLGLVMRR